MRGLALSSLFAIILALLMLAFATAIIFGTNPRTIADQSLCSGTGTALRFYSYFDGVTVASPDDATGIMRLCPPRIVSIADRESDEQISRKIGDELVICQNSFGGGQVNLFRDEARGSQTRYCGLCAKIDFDTDAVDGEPIEGFEDHLATHVVPGTGQTIGQILNADLPRISAVAEFESESIATEDAFSEGSIWRGDDLAVLYLYDKKASVARNGLEAFAVGAFGGAVLGARPGVGAAKMGRALAVKVGVGRATGWMFGPMGFLLAEVTGATLGGLAGLSNPDFYTDEWVGGVTILSWSNLSSGGAGTGLAQTLGCDQYVNFVEENT